MKKTAFLALAVAILGAAAFLLQCDLVSDLTGGDDGGAGADFDPNSYYTNTQIDTLLADIPRFYFSNTDAATITAAGFNAHSVTWTSPPKLSAVVMQVTVYNGSGDTRPLKIALSTTSDPGGSFCHITVPASGKFEMPIFWRYFSGNDGAAVTGLKLWLVEGDPTGLTIAGRPAYWFTGGKAYD